MAQAVEAVWFECLLALVSNSEVPMVHKTRLYLSKHGEP